MVKYPLWRPQKQTFSARIGAGTRYRITGWPFDETDALNLP